MVQSVRSESLEHRAELFSEEYEDYEDEGDEAWEMVRFLTMDEYEELAGHDNSLIHTVR